MKNKARRFYIKNCCYSPGFGYFLIDYVSAVSRVNVDWLPSRAYYKDSKYQRLSSMSNIKIYNKEL